VTRTESAIVEMSAITMVRLSDGSYAGTGTSST
jgi:hypothetical protein